MRGYVTDVSAQNLSPKLYQARGSLFISSTRTKYESEKTSSYLTMSPPREREGTVHFTVMTSGVPASLSMQNTAQIPKTISLTVNSVRQGAHYA